MHHRNKSSSGGVSLLTNTPANGEMMLILPFDAGPAITLDGSRGA